MVLGEDVVQLLPKYLVEEILPRRLEGILKNLERFSGNPKMLHILTGETARLMAFLHGSSLRKGDVIRKLEELGDEDAVKIYRAYLDGRKKEFGGEFLAEFVNSRIERIRGDPNANPGSGAVAGIRTRVTGLEGRCPRPG